MEPILLDNIPGLNEAVEKAKLREAEIRRRPFLPLAPVIAGVPLLPMTLRHYVYLEAVETPFLLHEFGELGDVLQFLWTLSPEHVFPTPWLSLPDVRKRRAAFIAQATPRARRCILGKVCKKIRAFVEETLFECPRGNRHDREYRSIAHLAASIIDEVAGDYQFPDEVLDELGQPDRRRPGIMDMPLARILQYRRCRTVRKYPGTELVNPLSDGVERQCIIRHLARVNKPKRRAAHTSPSSHPE